MEKMGREGGGRGRVEIGTGRGTGNLEQLY